MSEYVKVIHNNEAHEVTVPARKETFDAQVLVMAKERKEMQYPMMMSMPYPLNEICRVLASGKFRVELVASSIANGKPTLIIEEVDEKQP